MKFRIGLLRQFKLNRLKEIRELRDELLIHCENKVKAERLIREFPGVVDADVNFAKTITIKMDTGHTYQFLGYGNHLQGFKDVGKFIYDIWANDELDYGDKTN